VWSPATESEPRRTEVILDVSTFDKKGKELKRDAKLMKFSAPPSVQPTGRIHRNLNIPYKIEHDPKVVRVRFTVRVSLTGRIGTADYTLGQAAGPNGGKEAPKK
jgi:hypothetical protein